MCHIPPPPPPPTYVETDKKKFLSSFRRSVHGSPKTGWRGKVGITWYQLSIIVSVHRIIFLQGLKSISHSRKKLLCTLVTLCVKQWHILRVVPVVGRTNARAERPSVALELREMYSYFLCTYIKNNQFYGYNYNQHALARLHI